MRGNATTVAAIATQIKQTTWIDQIARTCNNRWHPEEIDASWLRA